MPPSPATTVAARNCSVSSGEAALVVVRLEGVEQAGRAAGERGALAQVGHQVGQVVDVEDAVLVVVARDEADQPGRVERAEVVDEDRVAARSARRARR